MNNYFHTNNFDIGSEEEMYDLTLRSTTSFPPPRCAKIEEPDYSPPGGNQGFPVHPELPPPHGCNYVALYLEHDAVLERFIITPRMTLGLIKEKIAYRLKNQPSKIFLEIPESVSRDNFFLSLSSDLIDVVRHLEDGRFVSLLTLDAKTLFSLLREIRGKSAWIKVSFDS